jgi:hypothetical protein
MVTWLAVGGLDQEGQARIEYPALSSSRIDRIRISSALWQPGFVQGSLPCWLAYSAPSLVALVTCVPMKKTRPRSAPTATRIRRMGATSANSTRLCPLALCRGLPDRVIVLT